MNRSPSRGTGLSIAALLGVLDIVGLVGLFTGPAPPAAGFVRHTDSAEATR
jgi:hypothetical protein